MSKNRYKTIFPCKFNYLNEFFFPFLVSIFSSNPRFYLIDDQYDKCNRIALWFIYKNKLVHHENSDEWISFITQVKYFSFIPDDHSRVILKTSIDCSNYINANFIKVGIVLTFNMLNASWYFPNVCLLNLLFFFFFIHGTSKDNDEKIAYIATQGKKKNVHT